MRNFREYIVEKLKDPQEMIDYLKVALEEYEKDQNTEAFLLALRTVAEAKGGISELAKKTSLNRQNVYRVLSSKGNPKLDTLEALLHALGYRLSIEPLEKQPSK